MALNPCRECRKEISTDATTCPNCGKNRPHGGVSTGSGCVIIVVALLAMGWCVGGVGPDAPTPQPGPTTGSTKPVGAFAQDVPYRVVQRWAINNGGSGQVIVVDSTLVTPELGQKLAETLKRRTAGDRNAFVYVYRTERAASMRPSVMENLDTPAPYHDRNYIGTYTRNGNTGFHRFSYHPAGLNGTVTEFRF